MKRILLITLAYTIAFIYLISFVPGLYFQNFIFVPLCVINFILILIQLYLIDNKKSGLMQLASSNLVFSVLALIPILGYIFLFAGVITNILIASIQSTYLYNKLILNR